MKKYLSIIFLLPLLLIAGSPAFSQSRRSTLVSAKKGMAQGYVPLTMENKSAPAVGCLFEKGGITAAAEVKGKLKPISNKILKAKISSLKSRALRLRKIKSKSAKKTLKATQVELSAYKLLKQRCSELKKTRNVAEVLAISIVDKHGKAVPGMRGLLPEVNYELNPYNLPSNFFIQVHTSPVTAGVSILLGTKAIYGDSTPPFMLSNEAISRASIDLNSGMTVSLALMAIDSQGVGASIQNFNIEFLSSFALTPTATPSARPSITPTNQPPVGSPTATPTTSSTPTRQPTPTRSPTATPTRIPSTPRPSPTPSGTFSAEFLSRSVGYTQNDVTGGLVSVNVPLSLADAQAVRSGSLIIAARNADIGRRGAGEVRVQVAGAMTYQLASNGSVVPAVHSLMIPARVLGSQSSIEDYQEIELVRRNSGNAPALPNTQLSSAQTSFLNNGQMWIYIKSLDSARYSDLIIPLFQATNTANTRKYTLADGPWGRMIRSYGKAFALNPGIWPEVIAMTDITCPKSESGVSNFCSLDIALTTSNVDGGGHFALTSAELFVTDAASNGIPGIFHDTVTLAGRQTPFYKTRAGSIASSLYLIPPGPSKHVITNTLFTVSNIQLALTQAARTQAEQLSQEALRFVTHTHRNIDPAHDSNFLTVGLGQGERIPSIQDLSGSDVVCDDMANYMSSDRVYKDLTDSYTNVAGLDQLHQASDTSLYPQAPHHVWLTNTRNARVGKCIKGTRALIQGFLARYGGFGLFDSDFTPLTLDELLTRSGSESGQNINFGGSTQLAESPSSSYYNPDRDLANSAQMAQLTAAAPSQVLYWNDFIGNNGYDQGDRLHSFREMRHKSDVILLGTLLESDLMARMARLWVSAAYGYNSRYSLAHRLDDWYFNSLIPAYACKSHVTRGFGSYFINIADLIRFGGDLSASVIGRIERATNALSNQVCEQNRGFLLSVRNLHPLDIGSIPGESAAIISEIQQAFPSTMWATTENLSSRVLNGSWEGTWFITHMLRLLEQIRGVSSISSSANLMQRVANDHLDAGLGYCDSSSSPHSPPNCGRYGNDPSTTYPWMIPLFVCDPRGSSERNPCPFGGPEWGSSAPPNPGVWVAMPEAARMRMTAGLTKTSSTKYMKTVLPYLISSRPDLIPYLDGLDEDLTSVNSIGGQSYLLPLLAERQRWRR